MPFTALEYAQQRARMVETQIVARGVSDPRVLKAMLQVERHRFVREPARKKAYDDTALSIGEGQTISQPYVVALMTEHLGLSPEDRVLEIGTGCGYQTAVLSTLCAHVYTIERHRVLSEQAAARLGAMGVSNVSFKVGDGTQGWAKYAPFDAILITAGGPRYPDALLLQLKLDTGRLLMPRGDEEWQSLMKVNRHLWGLTEESLGEVRFVPLIGAGGWPEDVS